MTFIEKLNMLMKKNNINRAQLTKELHIGKNQIKYWEDNKTIPDGSTLLKISEYFDVPIDFLVNGKEPVPINEKISFLMDCCYISNKNLANKLGVNLDLINSWKNGTEHPSDEQIVKMAKLFDVAVDYLLYDYNFVPSHFRNLNEDEWAALDIYRETNGELVGKSLLYSQKEKEKIFPILKKIKTAPEGQPLTEEQEALIASSSDLSNEDLKKVIEYIELLKLRGNQ